MDCLPVEITAHIFSFLTCYDLFCLQRVSKTWKTLLTDPTITQEISKNDFIHQQSSFETLEKLYKKVQKIKRSIKEQLLKESELLSELNWLQVTAKEHHWLSVLHLIFSSSYYSGYASTCLSKLVELDSVFILERATQKLSPTQRKDLVNIRCAFGRSALHTAVFFDNFPVVEWLVQQNANLEMKEDTYKQTPLQVAVQRSSLPIIKLLVQHNSDVFVCDKDRMSTMSLSTFNSNPEVSRYCREVLFAR